MRALLPLVLIVACGCPQKPAPSTGSTTMPTPNQPPPTQTPPAQTPGQGSAAEPAPSWPKGGPGIGENCGAGDACAQGLTCVAYYGIAGPRGPQFKSCEIKCTGDGGCPADHKCITIADGPGQVCRK